MVGTFPLNVEAGSPQYTTVSQINYSAGAGASIRVTPATTGTTPVSNSYYTFQSQDGQYWMTAYVGKWTNNDGVWTADVIWSSSNTNSLPAQSICWCVWAKEYYDSLITQIGSGGGGGAVIKSIEYDLPTTTFTITDTNDQVTEINTSVSQNGIDYPPYNNSDLVFDYYDTPVLRLGYMSDSGTKNVSDMTLAVPVISQTHEIYFDVSGADLYVRRESPAGMYELLRMNSPIEEGIGSIVVPWKLCDAIRFHIPEDNFGSNYTVSISSDPDVGGWRCEYLNTETHQGGQSSISGNGDLPRFVLTSASTMVWIYCNAREMSGSELAGAYRIVDVTISITRK